jgi:hypothetical protein
MENISSTDPSEKRDWKKIVADSNGKRIFMPDQFMERAKELKTKLKELNDAIEIMAEKELVYQNSTQTLFFDLREYLAKEKNPVWLKELGFDTEALKENIYIVNILEPTRK